MTFFGPSKEQKEAYIKQAQELEAVKDTLEKLGIKNKEAQEGWRNWHQIAEQAKAQAEANGRLAESNGKHAESLQKEIDQLRATLAAFTKVSEGWYNFGGATWFSLDSIVEFTTIEVDIDSSDSNNSTKAIVLSEINGKSIASGNLQMRKLDVFLALLEARRKSRRGGGGGGGDLPNAPIPGLRPTQPTPGFSC